MIGIYATSDAALTAGEVAAALAEEWPQLSTIHGEGAIPPELPFIGSDAAPAWDDLLLVVYGAEGLPEAVHELLRREIQSAQEKQRASRVLPVSTLDDHRRPPEPLDRVKAIHCPSLANEYKQPLTRRIGALLYLWLRADDRKIFISHRQADGQGVAIQVTKYLKARGYNAWRDEERLRLGDIVQEEIERHVADANFLLLLDTPRAGESEWIAREVDAAIAGFVPLASVRLRPPDATGRATEASVYATAELFCHRIQVDLSPDGVVGRLSDDQLEGMLVEVEGYLSNLLRDRQALADKVEANFCESGFVWKALDARSYVFDCGRPDEVVPQKILKMLSHCSVYTPRYRPAVKAFQKHAAQNYPNQYSFWLFLYNDPPLSKPELERLALDGEMAAPLLVLDPGRLSRFLLRYQADPASGTRP